MAEAIPLNQVRALRAVLFHFCYAFTGTPCYMKEKHSLMGLLIISHSVKYSIINN